MINEGSKYRGYHASAWKCIPAESNTIAIFDFIPFIFESFVVHGPWSTQLQCNFLYSMEYVLSLMRKSNFDRIDTGQRKNT